MTTMTTAPITPLSDRDSTDAVSWYTSRDAMAGHVVWDMLTHDPIYGPDIAQVATLAVPEGMGEDMFQFLYDTITEAAGFGHALARLNLDAFDPSKLSTADVARALAALHGRETVEDGDTFDPEYRTKWHALSEAKRKSREDVA